MADTYMKKLPKFTPLDVVMQDEFYLRLIRTANLSGPECESSFGVYAYTSKPDDYKMTKPLKEFPGKCVFGKSILNGMTYGKPGYGLWRPEKSFSVIDVHFHDRDNAIIPSQSDFESARAHRHYDIVDQNTIAVVGAAVIGIKKPNGIELLIYQHKTSPAHLAPNHSEQMDQIVDAAILKNGTVDFSDDKIKYQMLNAILKTNLYNAEIIKFSNKTEYNKEIQKIKNFKLWLNTDFEVDDFSDQKLNYLAKLHHDEKLDEIDEEERLRELGREDRDHGYQIWE